MDTEDVIELGSSEDEATPAAAPKKKIKPRPNAMVHIPSKLPGVTIKPAKLQKPSFPQTLVGKRAQVIKEIPRAPQGKSVQTVAGKFPQALVGKGVTVTKLNNVIINPHNKVNIPNGRPSPKPVIKQFLSNFDKAVQINPVSLMKKLATSQVKINKVNPNVVSLKKPIKIQQSYVPQLPPNITITKGQGMKRMAVPNISNMRKKQKVIPKASFSEVLTVELDDDEVPHSSANPQWYLRPEEQNCEDIAKQNNEEPQASKMIEITIEDSPVKPHNKQNCEIGSGLAITIEDSPNKVTDKVNSGGSDDENKKCEERQSRKKLDYPKEKNHFNLGASIEIEIAPMEVVKANEDEEKQFETLASNDVVEIYDSPAKSVQDLKASTPKKEGNKNQVKPIPIQPKVQLNDEKLSEFHPVYEKFINLCLKLENSDDMNKIVEKKIKAYYRQVPKLYTESEEFIDMVSSKIVAITAAPEKMYLFIKDIVDELNLQRKMSKAQVPENNMDQAEPEKYSFEGDIDSKHKRQIRKLEKTLKKLHRAIQKLEEQEVDFDDEEDSVYLLTERYKERMIRVHAKFCQLTNTKMPSEPRVHIEARPGQPTGPAKRLEKWVNKKVPIGKPLPFPDFHDVLRCVREANEEDKLGWNEADIMEEARDLFVRCGKKLKRRRQENDWRLAASRISSVVDPAEINEDLKKSLDQNSQLSLKRETELFNKYAERQSQMKLVAEEIGDKEAEESPVESEDEETSEDICNLEDKEKRKERLKRLIHEKTKKNNKENTPAVSEGGKGITQPEGQDKEVKTTYLSADVAMENVVIDSGTTNDANSDGSSKRIEIERAHSISDDNDKIDSDVDELHLLQKLHSGSEISTSTLYSSGCDTPVDISDTIQSSGDNKTISASDVISIENSSYSESETAANIADNNDMGEFTSVTSGKKTTELINSTIEIEYSFAGVEKKRLQSNNDEYNDSVENILLASSDDESGGAKEENTSEEAYVNLKDYAMSIEETVIQMSENDGSILLCGNPATGGVNCEMDIDLTQEKIPTNDGSQSELKGENDIDCRADSNSEKITKHIDLFNEKATSNDNKTALQEKQNKSVNTKSDNSTSEDNIPKNEALSKGTCEITKIKPSTSKDCNETSEYTSKDHNEIRQSASKAGDESLQSSSKDGHKTQQCVSIDCNERLVAAIEESSVLEPCGNFTLYANNIKMVEESLNKENVIVKSPQITKNESKAKLDCN